MHIAIVLGTRPEIIKCAPLVRACAARGLRCSIIHSNQHYSANMDAVFFDELDLPQPVANLHIGSGSHGEMSGRMMIALEKEMQELQPDVLLVQGDTNTVMVGALIASKMGIPIGHVEACLRSYDRTMPEEINRIVTDHISTWLFCPTELQRTIGQKEGFDEAKLFVTGNTIVDAVLQSLPVAERKSQVLENNALVSGEFILATCHRPATTDDRLQLTSVMEYLQGLAKEYNMPVFFPIHPRTRKMVETFGLHIDPSIILAEPVGFLEMLRLQKHAFLVATDSGGLQEESCILQTKCAVMRDNTERPEALDVGGCSLVGTGDSDQMLAKTRELLAREVTWYCPFGDGTAADQMIDIIQKTL